MSVTPGTQPWTGFFSDSGSPALRVTIKGPFGQGVEFEAILDTGFTGFVCMPLVRALPLGLMLYGTTSVELADGSKSIKLTAKGTVQVQDEEEVGLVILEPNASDVLLGMAFLRLFKKTLIRTDQRVFLVPDTHEPPEDPGGPGGAT